MKIARHFFVCGNQRRAGEGPGGKPCCGERGAREILAALEEGLASHPEIWSTVAVTQAACLGPCFEGPTIVVYPEGAWYVGVTPDDVPELVREHLVGGRPVERLLRSWPAPE